MHHLKKDDHLIALKEIYRILKKGGKLVITNWYRYQKRFMPFALWSRQTYVPFGKYKRYYHLFSKGEARLYFASYLGVHPDDGKPHWTSSCTDCGKCEEKCPQNIQIRQEFKKEQEDLEKPGTKMIAGLLRFFMNWGKRDKRNKVG